METKYDPSLYNYDLAPVKKEHKTWTWINFTTIWMGMIHNIVAWETAGSLIMLGMSVWQALSAVIIANIVLISAMWLNSVVGGKYGIPFPVIIRAAFGHKAAHIPVVLRAFVAIFWFAVQAYAGSAAVNAIFGALIPGWNGLSKFHLVGMGLNSAIAVVLFWLLHMWIVSKGMHRIKIFELWAGPLVIILGIILVIWSINVSHGLGPLFEQPSKLSSSQFWTIFPVSVTGLVGVWATLVLNISDFTRFTRSQKDQAVGQFIGLPGTAIAFALMSIITTSGTVVAFGKAIWNPVTLLQKFDNPFLLFFGAIALIIITLSVNIAGNVVSPGYDLVNLFPKKLNFVKAGNISIILSLFFVPWLWFNNAGVILTVMGAVGGALGPVAGIMFADFYIVHHRHYEINSFYLKDSEYSYSHGWNYSALIAMAVGTIISLIGLFVPTLKPLYSYSWFLGVGAGFIIYALLMRNTENKTKVREVSPAK
ncbi:NCS1 family nucleobase:cation symporter-1 [Sporolactobacillus kofuensis]|uniref:NCS1 family nucleobase:cation symporter-1 n=1 Tax=Sporolactobacillus kofuensis TaxID=269672 RepID=A0ABW1WHB0_9BACL|nr:NCS1 family nucleobase:cation symporter-1 [Sporolactobacillus kofuensis]MCO7175812.1 NCS1 family nucleobase:cation symporter-1 [Sporolactobacillus kofuensis]